MKRFKIAVFHPRLNVGAGSEVSAVWIVEALKNDYDVSIITCDHADFESLNNAYFSDLEAGEVNIIKVLVPSWLKNNFDALRCFLLAGFCREKASEFDLMISTYNVMDFGKRGIQYIVDFSFDDKLRRKLDKGFKGVRGLLYMQSPLRWIYLKTCEIIAGSSRKGWARNITIANSEWTAGIMERSFGIRSRVVYHPVPGVYPDVGWEDKENGFICMARIVPEKGIENTIEILRRLRQRGLDLHLHLLGRADDRHYTDYLNSLCEKDSHWLFMEGLVLGVDKLKFIAQHKYGISGRQNEPFGIAVAEMVKAGSIVWVPNGGGQKEIVGHKDLIYSDIEDAVNKIERVLGDDAMQASLRRHLSMRNEIFSVDKFKLTIKDLVSKFFKDYEIK
jgi:glycosyltransferase involved in cell wall biosynthesis